MRTRITIHRTRMRTSAFGLQTIRIKKKRISLKDWRTTVGTCPRRGAKRNEPRQQQPFTAGKGKNKAQGNGVWEELFSKKPGPGN